MIYDTVELYWAVFAYIELGVRTAGWHFVFLFWYIGDCV